MCKNELANKQCLHTRYWSPCLTLVFVRAGALMARQLRSTKPKLKGNCVLLACWQHVTSTSKLHPATTCTSTIKAQVQAVVKPAYQRWSNVLLLLQSMKALLLQRRPRSARSPPRSAQPRCQQDWPGSEGRPYITQQTDACPQCWQAFEVL